MIALYRLLFPFALLLALPFYALRMLRRGGYAKDFSHRFGKITVPPKRPGVSRIWIQAVSVGEIGAIEPLLREFAKTPDTEIVLTTTTSTGYALARERLGALTVATGVFPLDFAPFNRAAWERIRPDMIVLTEGELWPEHLHRARSRGVPAALINARLSDRSFRRYRRVRAPAARLFGKLALALAGTASDLERLRALGVAPEKSALTGNLKCDVAVGPPPDEAERRALFTELFGPCPETRPLVLLGSSTWPGEEAMLISLWREISATRPARLLIAPRHAERRAEILALPGLGDTPFRLRSRDRETPVEAMIHIADTTGELRRLSRAADLAFIGKSLRPHEGGQTPIECALLGIPQVFGPAMSNFRDISGGLVACGAAERADDEQGVRIALGRLAENAATRDAMRRAALDWASANRGATKRTFEALRSLLRSSPFQTHPPPLYAAIFIRP